MTEETLGKAADELYDKYLDTFHTLWGIPPEKARKLGVLGNTLFEAEFACHGPAAYNTSVIMPIRNATFNHFASLSRHYLLHHNKDYDTPILDYGCGIGYHLMWLKLLGYRPQDLWGYDLPGPQEQVTKHVFAEAGINFGIPGAPETIFCTHVLEHLEDPFAMIDYLRSLGGHLYASCVDNEGHGHLVDKAKCKEVIAYLRKEDNFIEDHW